MKPQAVAFDLDDTLLRDDRTLSPLTLSVLRQAAAQGLRIIPASGRARDSMIGFVREIGCASAFIACNGAELYGPDGQLWAHHWLSADFAREVEAFAQAEGCHVQSYQGNRFYYDSDSLYAAEYARVTLLEGVRVPSLTAHQVFPTPKLLMIDSEARIAQLLVKARARFGSRASVSCSKPTYLEINPLTATKGQALQALSARLGFSLSETLAFGDGLNDLPMLTAAGLGVAMDNARPEVKAQADDVCLSNQQDGVARYLDNLLRKEAEA